MIEGLFETKFACEISKLMSGRKTGYSSLNAENDRDVTNDIMFAYVHEKINILHSVLSIFLSLFII